MVRAVICKLIALVQADEELVTERVRVLVAIGCEANAIDGELIKLLKRIPSDQFILISPTDLLGSSVWV